MGSGSQIAGTRSRRVSSVSTQASIRSVLQANGARPFTFCTSAISTCQPCGVRKYDLAANGADLDGRRVYAPHRGGLPTTSLAAHAGLPSWSEQSYGDISA